MNVVILTGHLTKDPEMNKAGETSVAKFTLGVDRPVGAGKEKASDFPRITVFGKQAENCEKFLKKGSLVGVTGSIQTGSYKNKDDQTVYTTEVVASRVEFLGRGDKPAGSAADTPAKGEEKKEVPIDETPTFEAVEDDDDIPF